MAGRQPALDAPVHTTNSRVTAFALEQASRLTRDRLLAYRDEERAPTETLARSVCASLLAVQYVAVRHFDARYRIKLRTRSYYLSTKIVQSPSLGLKANASLHGKDRAGRMIDGHVSDDVLRNF